jgi:hypothetical protein
MAAEIDPLRAKRPGFAGFGDMFSSTTVVDLR